MILTIRTDKPEAEVGICSASGDQLSHHSWYAHRELSATLLSVIHEQLAAKQMQLEDINGIVVYRGPGSFTGLRIGITVANTMAYSLNIAVVGTTGDSWQQQGVALLQSGKNERIVLPMYGAEAHITLPKK